METKVTAIATQLEADDVVGGGGSEMVKMKLCFLNKLLSTIFTTNHTESDNGEPLQIALPPNRSHDIDSQTEAHMQQRWSNQLWPAFLQ